MESKQTIYYGEMQMNDWYFFVAATAKGLCYVSSQPLRTNGFHQWMNKHLPNANVEKNEMYMKPYMNQLMEYVCGERKVYDLSLDLIGTTFQKAVWNALVEIPFGETTSYSAIAKKISKPQAVRAIGSAIGKNPILIVVPCHRVLRKNGELSGFREGISMKRKLLELEKGM